MSNINSLSNFDHIKTDKVTIKKEDFVRIRNNYNALLYFASLILCKNKDNISVQDLKRFSTKKYHKHEEAIKNYSWPVDLYLIRIKELEKQLREKNNE